MVINIDSNTIFFAALGFTSSMIGYGMATLYWRNRLRKSMLIHIRQHTMSMTGVLKAAAAVAEQDEEVFVRKVIIKGHDFGLNLAGAKSDGTIMNKDSITKEISSEHKD